MLLRRGKIYYCRVWVPLDLREKLGRKELKKTLYTNNRKDAKAAAAQLVAKTEAGFYRLRTGMLTHRELEQIAAEILSEFSGRINFSRRERHDPFVFISNGIPTGMSCNTDINLIDALLGFPRDPEIAVCQYEARIANLEKQRATGLLDDELRRLTRRLIDEKRLDVELPLPSWFDENSPDWFSPPPPSFAQLADAVIDGLIEGHRLELDRVQGRRDPAKENAIAARIEATKHRPKLSELWESYKQLKLAKGSWGPKSQQKYNDLIQEIFQILGDKELVEYSNGDAIQLLNVLEKKGNKPSTRTLKLEFVSSLFRHALKTPESVDRWKARGNPFTEMQVQAQGDAREMVPYTIEDLNKILVGLLKVRKAAEPHRFWVPLIALYSGMRQNEVCQLRVEDIELDNNFHVFRIRHRPELQQTTKSRKSRTCPVHPMLRRLGFLNYIEQQRKAGEDRLFPKLSYTGAKGWCGKVRNWWNETFQEEMLENRDGKSFHSLRKNFIDWFKQNGVYETAHDRAIVQSMIGHEDGDVTAAHYEQEFSPATQLGILIKLNYQFPPQLILHLKNKEY